MNVVNKASENFLFSIEKVRSIARFLFHLSVKESERFIPENIELKISRRTQRIRYIYLDENLLCSIRPNDGLILLTILGGKILKKIVKSPRIRVIVQNEVSEFIVQGRNVFAKHVIDADEEIRPGSEVMVVNQDDELSAIGKAILNKDEMLSFDHGIAVKVRHGLKN